jgi:hypothetical protein
VFLANNNMNTESQSYTTLYIVLVFTWATGFGLQDHLQAPLLLLKALITSNKMCALLLKLQDRM